MNKEELVYVGIKGSALALSSVDGRVVWQTNLKGSDFVHLVLDGDNLYASTRGEIFCLDAASGQQRWNNPMKGFGLGIASITTRNTTSTAGALIAELKRREEQSRAAAAGSAGGAGAVG